MKKPDYKFHDERYKARLKRGGFVGWEREADYQEAMEALNVILQRGFAPDHGALLEIGCGAGNYSCFFAGKGFEVVGIDISETAIKWAHENAEKAKLDVQFILDDVIDLSGIDDESRDFVFDGHLLHCIIGDDRKRLLTSVHRVLKPGGFFMVRSVVTPVQSSDDLVVDEETGIAYLNGDTPYRYYPSAKDLLKEVGNAGFKILDWEYTLTTEDGYGFQHVTAQCQRI
jgi:ubiquinone/menaquinone biosynthesis C-methylase UbiE